MSNFVDRTGLRYGSLTAIELGSRSEWGKRYWKCKCDCGNEVEVLSNSLGSGLQKSCGCSRKGKNNKRFLKFEYVRDYFLSHGCELLETEYTGCNQKMRYRCVCGNESVIMWRMFMSGHRCSKCAIAASKEKNSGDKGNNWNPNLTDEHRKHTRKYLEYFEWRNSVITRDDKKCIICGSGHGIQAHHLNSYIYNPSQRLDVDNGVTLCFGCHRKFHTKYGKYKNTKEQFDEFLDGLSPGERVKIIPKYNPIRKGNSFLTFQGETLTVTQWARKLEIPRYAIYSRISSGWSVDDTLTMSVDRDTWKRRRAK